MFGHRISFVMALVASGPGLILQAQPTARALTERRVFQEPLVPVGGKPTETENEALWRALDAYVATGDVKALTAFLEIHPQTPWKASLLSSLGWVYRRDGYLGRAENAWRESWELAKGAPEKIVADWSAANLADLLGRLGRQDELATLLKESKPQAVPGAAGSLLLASRQQLEAMQQDPAHTFLCGPKALGDLAMALGRTSRMAMLEGLGSGPKGTNLAQLQTWGKSLELDLAGIRLEARDPVPVPSLLSWKAGHFAAVVKEENGRYLVRNYLAGEDKWITEDVLREERGTHALVEKGRHVQKTLSSAELENVWGAGTTSGPDPKGPNTKDKKLPSEKCPNGMATYSFYAAQVSLLVEDIPVWYTPPIGPAVDFHVYYNQWDLQQPATFTYWNLGPKWTSNWLSYVQDNPSSPGSNTSIYLRGGGVADYKGYNSATGVFSAQYYHHDILVRTSSTSYERRFPDGSKEVFAAPDGATSPRRVFLTQIVDPSGNALTLGYDAQRRLVTVTDALNQVTRLSYELGSDPLKVTKITDPFGRTAQLAYNASKQLTGITDMGGLTSQFTYGPTPLAPSVGADFLNALMTPYGTTTFAAGTSGADRWLQATDPLGQSERAEYRNYTGSVPASDLVAPSGFLNNYLYYRNTFYWDKRAMASGAGDWKQAHIYHFLHSQQNSSYTSPLLESEKRPLDGRVWYRYGTGSSYTEDASSLPTAMVRILDDGTEQRSKAEYNAIGKVIKTTDAVGRVTSYTYSSDGVDLLEVRNTTGSKNDLLAKYTYNAQHKPLTVTDAAGQTTTFTYNAAGQIATITNPRNETTIFSYGPAQGGYLMSITGPVAGSITGFTHDTYGRVRTVTGSDGNTTTTEYDDLDRPTRVTYQDGTTEAMAYDKLDMVGRKDRQGRWTTMSYNALWQLSEVQDAAGRSTHFDWCDCGSLQQLTDPMGRVTNWWRDLQGRVIGKQLHDGTSTSYTYDSAGRLVTRVDAKGQATAYQYGPDDNLTQVSYPNALKATPTVGYVYDGAYNRLASMTDGYGTTTYTYHSVTAAPTLGAGRLATVSGPFPDSTISYAYDELGRVVSRGINDTREVRTFDALGRVSTITNPLGPFRYAYQGTTSRLDNILLPNGQKTVFTYFDATQDFRLQEITNQRSDSSVISAFNYTYDPDGTIRTWSQQADVQIPKVYSFSYDAANQLIGALLTQNGAQLHQYVYGYDLAGNRTSEQIDGHVTTTGYNDVNQLKYQRTTSDAAASAMPATQSEKTGSTMVLPNKKQSASASTAQNP